MDVPEACLEGKSLTLDRVGSDRSEQGSGRIADGKAFHLAPGADRKIDLELSRIFRLKEIGRYRISWSCGAWETPHYDFFVTAPYDPASDRLAVVTTDLGTFEVVLMPEQAPQHVKTFVELARAGFYDGAIVRRVIPGVQAEIDGPVAEGIGGMSQQLAPEVDPAIRPGKGLIGSIRTANSVTSASGFFVLLDFQPGFRGLHTFFGYVRSGMEVLDALNGVEVGGDSGQAAFLPKKSIAVRKIEIKAP